MEYASYELHTKQVFTDDGRLGVKLLLGSPVLTGILYWILMTQDLVAARLVVVSLLLIVSALAFIAGGILVVIGRRQITAVNKKMVTPKSGGLWSN